MDRGIYVAAAGGISQDRSLEVIAGNLAGSSVVGFKKEMLTFNAYQPPLNNVPPERVYAGIGGIVTDFSQGTLKPTGNTLDLAISGDGFFVVQTPEGRRYTRKGDFTIDEDGVLKTKNGYQVEGESGVITLTPGSLSIGQDGTINVYGSVVDRVKIVTFSEPYPLQKMAGGLFALTQKEVDELPVEGSSVIQGHLEMSNVDAVHEMVSMINALRAYESHMKLIQGFDSITESAIRLASGR